MQSRLALMLGRCTAALVLTTMVGACATSPQQAAAGSAPKPAPGGSRGSDTGSAFGAVTQGPGGDIALPEGVYLASLVVVDIVHDQGVPVAILPNVGNFPLGDVQLVVLNKWAGLQTGRHLQQVTIRAPDGKSLLAEDETEFAIAAEHVFLTIATPMTFTAKTEGFYQVEVALDGPTAARYRIRVRKGD